MFSIKYKIIDEAMAFYKVGSNIYNVCINKIQNNHNISNEDFYKLITAVVNLALSIELFIKSYIGDVYKHDLKELFEQLDNSIQQAIIEAMIMLYNQRNMKFNEDSFWEYLERNKNAFINWRYYYQNGKNVDITFLNDFATILYNLSSKIKQKTLTNSQE